MLSSFSALSVLSLVYLYQRRLLYPSYVPNDARTVVDIPSKWDMNDYEELFIESAGDRKKLHCYLIYHRSSASAPVANNTLLFLHANAGNMGHRLPFAAIFNRKMKMNVVMMSYRGYGKSEGVAEELGMKQDAATVLEHIKKHKLLGETKIVVYGQSIGGAVAIHLASKFENRIDAVVVENTFLSIVSVSLFIGLISYQTHSSCHSAKDHSACIPDPSSFCIPVYRCMELGAWYSAHQGSSNPIS